MFNPKAKLQIITIDSEHKCLIVDDALMQPEIWVQQAKLQQHKFASLADNFYPGIELRMPKEVVSALMNFIRVPARQYLNARRLIDGHCQLSMVTQAPEYMKPCQWICHRDLLKIDPGQNVIATVLYLFKNSALGGTHFFKPKQSSFVTDMFLQASNMMSSVEFEKKYAIRQGYMTASNEYFELVYTVPAKWNRLVIYDGMQFHSDDIQHIESMTDDPETARLTLNGFITGRVGVS
jgi:hypothetical protein